MPFRQAPEEKRQKEFERQCREATLEAVNRGHRRKGGCIWPFEVVRAESEEGVKRLRVSFFLLAALISLTAGIVLLSREYMAGGFLVLTLAPCLLLYPLVRFFFGGKDSIGAAVTTAIVEEVLKGEILKAAEKSSKRRKRR